MTRNNADFQGGSGFHITDTPDLNSEHQNARKLQLHLPGSEHSPAFLEYHVDPVGVTYIDYLKSNHEGQGHAEALLTHLYNKYPNHNKDWGEILHPAASHLYEKFSEKHGRSYSWDDWD
jgi:predicted acetyltransferase